MTRIVFAVAAMAGSLSGCAQVKEVAYDPQSGMGVVAIPANSGIWEGYNRRAAMAMIEKRVGPSFEIVEEREVVTGQQTVQNQQMNSDPNFTHQSATNVTTTRDVTEWQITYRVKGPMPSGLPGGSIQQTRYQSGSGRGVNQAGGIVPSVQPGASAAQGGFICADGNCSQHH